MIKEESRHIRSSFFLREGADKCSHVPALLRRQFFLPRRHLWRNALRDGIEYLLVAASFFEFSFGEISCPQLGPERPLAVSVYAMAGSAVIHVHLGTPFDASLFGCGEVRKDNC